VEGIIAHGFNRSYNGKNATVYGKVRSDVSMDDGKYGMCC
jgi:hypothetical protein